MQPMNFGIDTNVIMQGKQADLGNALAVGLKAGGDMADQQYTGAYRAALKEHGAGALGGNQAAQNALAAFDPAAMQALQSGALGMDQTRLSMDSTRQSMRVLSDQEARAAAKHAAEMSEVERKKERTAAEQALKVMTGISTPEEWDRVAVQMGANDFVGKFGDKARLIAGYQDWATILQAPDPDKRWKVVDDVLWDLQADGGPAPVAPKGADGKPLTGGKRDFKFEQDLRKEVNGLPQVKDFSAQTDALGRIAASAQSPDASGDMALIFNFMKMLDPSSVVRESEFAMAQNTGGLDARLENAFQQVKNGQRLTDQQRSDFVNRAMMIYGNSEKQYNEVIQQYYAIAENMGIDPKQVFISQAYVGDRPKGKSGGAGGAGGNGVGSGFTPAQPAAPAPYAAPAAAPSYPAATSPALSFNGAPAPAPAGSGLSFGGVSGSPAPSYGMGQQVVDPSAAQGVVDAAPYRAQPAPMPDPVAQPRNALSSVVDSAPRQYQSMPPAAPAAADQDSGQARYYPQAAFPVQGFAGVMSAVRDKVAELAGDQAPRGDYNRAGQGGSGKARKTGTIAEDERKPRNRAGQGGRGYQAKPHERSALLRWLEK